MYLFSEAKAGTGYLSFSLHEPMTRWYFIVASIDHQLQTAIKTSHQLETISIEHAQEVELELLRPSVYMHFYRHQYSTIIALSSSPVHQVAFGFQWFSHVSLPTLLLLLMPEIRLNQWGSRTYLLKPTKYQPPLSLRVWMTESANTLLKTNIATEHGPSQKASSFPTTISKGV